MCLTVQDGGQTFEYCKNISVGNCVGIEEFESLTSFVTFPNPTTDHINLTIEFDTPESFQMTLMDATGKKVMEQNIDNTFEYKSSIDVSHLPAGMYHFKIQNGDRIASKNIVITH